MPKKPEKLRNKNNVAETEGVDTTAIADEVREKVGRELSQSFSSLARGLMAAVGETSQSVEALVSELRTQSIGTGEAIGKADKVSENLQAIQRELHDRLSEEQLQSRIGELTRGAAQQLSTEFQQKLATLEEKHAELSQEHSALEEKQSRVRMEQQFLEDLVDENIEIVTRYKPGQIEILHQQLETLEAERDQLRERLTETSAKLDAAQRHNMRLLSEDDVADREEIEAKIEKLAKLREQQESAASLTAERDELKKRLEGLERLRERYEANQEAVERDRQLEADLREERSSREKLEESYNHERRERTKQTKKAERLKADVEGLRQQYADERTRVEELERELESLKEREEQLEEKRQEYLDKLQELAERRGELEQEHADRREELEAEAERELDARRAELRPKVEKELEQRYRAELDELERLRGVDERLARLLDDYRAATEERDAWETERRRREIRTAEEEERLRTLQDAVVEKDVELGKLKGEVALQGAEIAQRQVELEEIEAKLEALEQRFEERKKELEAEMEERAERLEARYERHKSELEVDRDARVQTIHGGAFDLTLVRPMRSEPTEAEWLDGVANQIEAADFHFPRRLVEAFHTSLKIATWAPLTVLAGVSGTGKSELPRLYSMFGGLHHKMLSVQPNWDSPQDLFGFFNYMDNRYKATELLQALVQSQKEPGEGFSDQLLVVLLDEMNLARVELYFSEFLSKLEARRGLEGDDVPYIGVDIGSGLDEERVFLGENVLFVGTMNEDETTNALSDKVLDRGNVITFPRPTNLRSRALRQPLQPTAERLRFETWKSWVVKPEDGLSEDVRNDIREFMNGVNEGLSIAHRAVGHRVLQAIENYVANHPSVRASDSATTDEAWQRALGDQVVQKIMPKLRGVETDTERGRACLDRVAEQLDRYTPELSDDFLKAREAGYGSFIWSSAEYLTRA